MTADDLMLLDGRTTDLWINVRDTFGMADPSPYKPPTTGIGALPGYAWDTRIGRYRITSGPRAGRLVSQSTIIDNLRMIAARSELQFAELGQALADERITISVFQAVMQQALKDLHLANSALARGGWGNLDNLSILRAGRTLRTEYRYLQGFIRAIEQGKVTGAGIADRASLYADNAYGAYWREADIMFGDSKTEERVYTADDERVCPECRAAESDGWRPIGTHEIPIHNRCRCGKDYR